MSMAMRIVIKGKEVSTSAAKLFWGLLAIFFIGLFLLAVLFILLPLLGVAMTVSVGLVSVTIMACVGVLVLVIGRTLLSAMVGHSLRLRNKIESGSKSTTKSLWNAKTVQKT